MARSNTGLVTKNTDLRQQGSVTGWFINEAVAAQEADPRTTRGFRTWSGGERC